MTFERETSWSQMKENSVKDNIPRRRKAVEDSLAPQFLPEPEAAPALKQKKGEKIILSEVIHSQRGKRKVRQTVGVRKDALVTEEIMNSLGHYAIKDRSDRKREDENRGGEKRKERRIGKASRRIKDFSSVNVSLSPENFGFLKDNESDEQLEIEKPEFQLPSADLLRLGGIAAVHAEDLFPEMYMGEATETEERKKIETRLSRFQEQSFLQIKNKEGKTVEEIIQDYISTIAEFFDKHDNEVKSLRLAFGYVSPEQYLTKYMQFLVRWYPKAFSGGDDYALASHDRLLSKLRDGLNKAFENSVEYPHEGIYENKELKKQKDEMHYLIYELVRKVYGIVDQLPYVDEFEHQKAA